jgi:hypothetical protein
LVHLASAGVVAAAPGAYFDQLTPNGRTARQGTDDELAAALWERSAALVGI